MWYLSKPGYHQNWIRRYIREKMKSTHALTEGEGSNQGKAFIEHNLAIPKKEFTFAGNQFNSHHAI